MVAGATCVFGRENVALSWPKISAPQPTDFKSDMGFWLG
jgi:hypothetical protein